MPQMPLYPNMYPQYNLYNPYMSAFMTSNPQQYSLQNSLLNEQMNNISNKNKDL